MEQFLSFICILICSIMLVIWNQIDILKNDDRNKVKHCKNICVIKDSKKEIDDLIKIDIDNLNYDQNIKDIILYSLEGGKRIRPIILISNYRMIRKCKTLPEQIIKIALAIEYIHCCSVVLDDIMDSDRFRRGTPSVYHKYGTHNAQIISGLLYGIGMGHITESIDLLYKSTESNVEIYFLINNMISDYIKELSLGQYMDLNPDKYFDVESMIQFKTSTLFEYCYTMPWIYSNSNMEVEDIKININSMRNISRYFGMIFQISDDFEDVDQDKRRGVRNYVLKHGYDISYVNYYNYVENFKKQLNEYNLIGIEIEQIIDYLNEVVDHYYILNKK